MTTQQLLAIGFTEGSIRHRAEAGRLIRVHRGVYAVGRPLTTPLEHGAAALLACGPRSALAGFSALAFWSLLGGSDWPDPPVVLVPAHDRRRHANIEIHNSKTLLRRDIRTRNGLRVTSPARTLLDVAPHLNAEELRRATGAALRRHLTRPTQLRDVIARNPQHPGTEALRPLATQTPGNLTRSPLEDDFATFCATHALPTPHTNVTIAGYEVDAWFPEERVIVEIDSVEFHADPRAFETDRERDAHHLALGVVTVRLTKERMRADPRREADRLHAILAARRAKAA